MRFSGRLAGLLALAIVGGLIFAHGIRAQSPPKEQLEQAAAARAILAKFDPQKTVPDKRKFHVVYFTPKGVPPADGWRERLPRAMEHVRAFHARQMKSYGFGPLTFALDYGADKKLVIHLVRGERTREHYTFSVGNNSNHHDIADRIRAESAVVLAAKGLKIAQESCVLFLNVLTVKDLKASVGGFGGWTAYGLGWGTAYLIDHQYVDVEVLTDKKRVLDFGSYKNTLALEASFRIGTIGHEGGHAFGLPHNRENAADRARGRSLMGHGNFDYGAELRGDGPGAFIPLADILRLVAQPAFSGTRKEFEKPVEARFRELSVESATRSFLLRGQIVANMSCHAVIAYLDPEGGGDYDAHTSVSIPDQQGRFTLACNDLVANRAAELRLVALFVNGASYQQSFPYSVAKDGKPDIRAIRLPRVASLQSYNFKTYYVRHSDWLGGSAEVKTDFDRQFSSFHLVPGLANPQLISIRPWNHGRDYLRHQQGRVKLQGYDDTELFRKDATFRRVPGLTDKSWSSFEAVNAPGHFLRHRNGTAALFELWVEKNDGSKLFAEDATFRIVKPLEKRLSESYADQISVTGTWSGADGSSFWVRQINDEVYWMGQSKDDGKDWTTVFRGTIKGKKITGRCVDVPRGKTEYAEDVTVEVVFQDGRPVEIRPTSGGGLPKMKRVK